MVRPNSEASLARQQRKQNRESRVMKIGGWTRLWIVLSYLWIVLSLLVTFIIHSPLERPPDSIIYYGMTFVPPVLLYLAGLTTRWIYRGFSAS